MAAHHWAVHSYLIFAVAGTGARVRLLPTHRQQ
jgi:hypothetical protein